MSAITYVRDIVIPAAFRMLPNQMNSQPARALLLAITLQEARATHRKQIGGPARSLWQFEQSGGVRGVLRHQASRFHAAAVLQAMAYGETENIVFDAMEHNDVLACCFARLLLYTHPKRLPERDGVDYAWQYYLDTWRPGKPHRQTWGDFYAQAWALLDGEPK